MTARAGHTATALANGTVLVAGGITRTGSISNIEFLDVANSQSKEGPRLLQARGFHTATVLADGRVLLAGGRNQGKPLASSEIYDPVSSSITAGPSLGKPRAGHTATLLLDGRVLLAGGDNNATAELYDPTLNAFVTISDTNLARSSHAAIRLANGNVLLVGGRGSAAATAEVFNAVSMRFTTVRDGLKAPRVSPELKLLPDGKVQVFGGDAETTMELFNPKGYFSSRGHLLRDSNSIIPVLHSPARGALVGLWNGETAKYQRSALGSMSANLERTAHTITSVPGKDTVVIVGGATREGKALDSVVTLSECSATVTTDLTDYYPGQIVTMSGAGWLPGEVISLNLHRDTNDPPDTQLSATADASGNWTNADYVVQEYDANVAFVLTATGDSGCVAQTTFTDSVTSVVINSPTTASPITFTSLPATVNVSFTYTTSATGTTTGELHIPSIGTVTAPLTPGTSQTATISMVIPAGTPNGTLNVKVTVTNGTGGGPGTGNATENASIIVGVPTSTPTTTTVTFEPGPYVYRGTPFTATAVTTGAGGFSQDVTASIVYSGDCTNVTSTNGCTATASFAGNASHQASSGNASITITKAGLTVTADDQSRDYGASDPTFTYAISGFVNGESEVTAPVTGTASCSTTATATSSVAGSPYPISCTIGSLAAANYSFSFVDGDLTINTATLTVTADDQSRDYGAADPAFTYAITGFANGEDEVSAPVTGAASCSTTAVATSTVAGSPYAITCTIGTLAAANYDFTFVDGGLTITTATLTVTADDQARDYGAPDPSFTYAITGFVNGEDETTAPVTGTASCSTTATATSSVAGSPYPISCTIGSLAAANYDFAFVDGDLTITTATLTVTADDQSRDYGAANPPLTYTITGFANGEDETTAPVTGTASCTTTAVAASSVAGSPYPISCTIGTLAAANYDFTFVGGDLTINTATLTVTADDKSRDYGAANPPLTYTITGFVNGETTVTAPVTGTASCSTTAVATSTVPGSPYPITCTIGSLAAANYDFTFVDGDLTVTTATLTVTAEDKTKVYLDPNPPLTYVITGFVNGETVLTAPVTGTASCTTTATAASTVAGSPYPITCTIGTLAAANYDFTFVAGKLTIGARAALVNYIGQQTFVTSGSSATTAQVTLSASVQDPTGTALAGAKMDFIDITNGLPGKVLASGVTVSPVPNSPANTGTANKIVTLSTGQFGAESYLILVKMTGDYDNSGQSNVDKTASVVVAKPATTNETCGVGTIAPLATSAGQFPGTVDDASFSVGMKYNKGGSNLQGKLTASVPQADGTTLLVKSNSISSMAVTNGGTKTSTIYTKATLTKVLNDSSIVTIDGNVTLRMDISDGATDKIAITVLSSKDSKLYYSNQWVLVGTTWKTDYENFKTGQVWIN